MINSMLSVHCRRNIDKAGGFDNYILLTRDKQLDSDRGMVLRRRMLERLITGSLPLLNEESPPDEKGRGAA
jgi:hypothetical protein